MRIRDFVAWLDAGAPADAAARLAEADRARGASAGAWRTWRRGALTVAYRPRSVPESADAPAGEARDLPVLLLGDDAEFEPAAPGRNLAAGVPLCWDATDERLLVHTSIVGLPPVYVHRTAHGLVVGSDLFLMARVPGVRFRLDPQGVAELATYGHPVEQRTLFADATLAPAGATLAIGLDGSLRTQTTWRMPDPAPIARPAFLEAQIAAFDAALRRTALDGSFLSLTAGLDTRAIFAVLARDHRLVPASTMTGRHRSLDARIAARLSRAYGVRHDLVVFDERFPRDLVRWTERASQLSGGLASLRQAPEVYLYAQVGGAYAARLSGNLGNQVGRGGTEGVSLRGAEPGILADGVRPAGPLDTHWLLGKLTGDAHDRIRYILQAEVPYSSVANYGVGSHHAAQQSPYASRGLIETLALRPPQRSSPSGSGVRMRLRDLRHRFLGEPAAVSFQRTLVARIGGAVAAIPVNWGWRPAGGISIPGAVMGAATLLGMAARATGLDAGPLRAPLEWTGLPALHDFHDARRWLRHDLAAFVQDTLRSQPVREGGLFEAGRLGAILDEHFSGARDHHATVTFALDLALAHRFYCTDPGR